MAKILYTSCLLLALAVFACTAEPPRGRPARIQSRLRFLARQEAAADPALAPTAAPAPYPAAGVTPEIPFDLPTETEAPVQPDQVYGPPDETYGPPAEETPDSTYLPPDNTYGPPAVDAAAANGGEAPAQAISQNIVFEKLIQPRIKAQSRRRPAALRKSARIVEVIRSEPAIVLTLH